MLKNILVTGATGKQGGSVVDQLLLLSATLSRAISIYALTRNISSSAAKALALKSANIHLVAGDLNDSKAIFSSIKEPIWGVYSVQVGIGQTQASEEKQGKGLIDAAIAHGVTHFVYSSAARLPTSKIIIPQFASKEHIEAHLKEKAASSNMTWTVLRPVGFFENLKPGFQGSVFAGILKHYLPANLKLAFIATDDIGWFAAQSFLNPEEYRSKSIQLAGDKLSFDEVAKIYREKMGRSLPLPLGGRLFPFLVTNVFLKELGQLFEYFSQGVSTPHLL
jgi:uncharacterized protein YbjT (DUF2867 family)